MITDNQETEGHSEILFTKMKPAEIDRRLYDDLGLIELVALGYGYSGSYQHLLEEAQIEYDGVHKKDRFNIFFALAQGKAIGSLSTTNWSSTDEKRGKDFWGHLQTLDPQLWQRAGAFSFSAFEVGGIVTHPEWRKQKIARSLLQQAITDLLPTFVLGVTKSPAAVLTRANTLRELDYRTFYGDYEVTGGSLEGLPPFSPITLVEAHLATRGQRLDKFGLRYVGTDLLLPTIPDVSTFPVYIKQAFASLLEGQTYAGETKTAVKPLISIACPVITG